MLYYLQYSELEKRLIIDTKLGSQCELKETIDASSWIQAKYKLGYPLTNYQSSLLDLKS